MPPAEVADYLGIGDAAIVYYKDIEVNYFRESMKLREMLALGPKVVLNDVGDLETLKDYTYQTGSDHEEVANQLVSVLRDGGDGREAREMAYVRRCLDWKDIGARLLHRITEARRRPPRARSMPRPPEASDDPGRRQRAPWPRGGLRARPSRGSRHGDGRAPAARSSTSRVDRAVPVATRRDLARPDVQPEV